MLQLNTIALKNFLMWKDQSFDFLPGITMIGGPNRSGKTLFFIRGLTTAMWGADAGKRGTDAARIPDGAKSVARFAAKGHSWAVTASDAKVALLRDGKALGTSGKKTGRAEFQSLFGGPMDLYDSSVMVSCSKPNPLVLAPPLQRADWFSSLFGVDAAIDKAQEGVTLALNAARKGKTELTFLEEQLASLQDERAKAAKNAMDATEFSALTANKLRLEKKLNRRKDAVRISENGFPTYIPGHVLDNDETLALVARIEEQKKMLAKAEAQNKVASDLRRVTARHKELTSQLKRYADDIKRSPISFEGAKALCDILEPIISAQTVKAKAWENGDKKLSKLMTTKIELVKRIGHEPSIDELRGIATRADATAAKFNSMTEAAEKMGEGLKSETCPHCGSAVTAKEVNKRIANMRSEIASLEKLHERQGLVSDYADTVIAIRALMEAKPDYDFIRLIRKHHANASARIMLEQDFDETKENIAALPTIKSVKPIDVSGIPESLSKDEKRLERHAVASQAKEDCEATQSALRDLFDDPDASFSASKIRSLKDEIPDLQNKLGALTARLSAADRANAVLDDMDNRIAGLEKKIALRKKGLVDLPSLEVLHRSFGRSGLRLTRIKELVEAFEATVNEGTSLLLPDGYVFKMSVDDKGVDIKFRRPNELVSDLSVLSGSEDKCWRLLCALALIRLCPSDMRCDTIVLDEMESLMDPQSRSNFARDYLPVLAEAVSKVVVVSPMKSSELPISFDRRFMVEVKNEVSRLVSQ